MTQDEITVAVKNALALSDLFDAIDAAANTTIPDVAEALAVEKDATTLAALLAQVIDARRVLDDARKEVESELHNLLEWKKPFVLEGVGTFERVVSDKREKWDVGSLLPEVVVRGMVSPEGEAPSDEELQIAGRAVSAIVAAFAFSYARKTYLKALKIQPDEYLTSSGGRPGVKFIATHRN